MLLRAVVEDGVDIRSYLAWSKHAQFCDSFLILFLSLVQAFSITLSAYALWETLFSTRKTFPKAPCPRDFFTTKSSDEITEVAGIAVFVVVRIGVVGGEN